MCRIAANQAQLNLNGLICPEINEVLPRLFFQEYVVLSRLAHGAKHLGAVASVLHSAHKIKSESIQ